MRKCSIGVLLLVGVLATVGFAISPAYYWYWNYLSDIPETKLNSQYNYLTKANGAHAIAMYPYGSGNNGKIWTTIMSEWRYGLTGNNLPGADTIMKAYEYNDCYLNSWQSEDTFPVIVHETDRPVNGQVAIGAFGKMLAFEEENLEDQEQSPRSASCLLALENQNPGQFSWPNPENGCTYETLSAAAVGGASRLLAFNFYRDREPPLKDFHPRIGHKSDGPWVPEDPWEDPDTDVYQWGHPTVAFLGPTSAAALAVFEELTDNHLKVTRALDGGETWSPLSTITGGSDLKDPCIAWPISPTAMLCYEYASTHEIHWSLSYDAGVSWTVCNPAVPMLPANAEYDHANVTCIGSGVPSFLVTARMKLGNVWSIRGAFGRFINGEFKWRPEPCIYVPPVTSTSDEPLNPFIAAAVTDRASKYAHACFVASRPWGSVGYQGRCLSKRSAYLAPATYTPITAEADGMGPGRWLLPDNMGGYRFASILRPYYMAGDIICEQLVHTAAGMGLQPALAVDADGSNWVAYNWDDTVWCDPGLEFPLMVFAGSGSAVPGQPSVVCYPNQANGVYVANVVFPVYDTAGATSKIMYARVDTGGVVLDTIESVANLGDSLPCISVFRSDTLLVTWQHGDSTIASMLCDYGPGTSGQPPAWTSPNLVAANGYHAMSRFDDNGTVLNVVWTRNNGSNYAIQRATCDVATTTFGTWSQSATPGDTGSAEKANPVFAGLGVSCWQEKDDGKWIIKGFVRGEEETFVANDTDAYHPHAVAESSAISPSIDQVRVHLLYTAGVTFEVDSGVYDTGETRYRRDSLCLREPERL